MQINKGEGVFVKLRDMISLLATWPVVVMKRKEWGALEMTIWKRALNEERERRVK